MMLTSLTVCTMDPVGRRGPSPKPPQELKSVKLLIRCLPEEKEAFIQAAQSEGKTLSAWIRDRLDRASKKISRDRG